MDSIDNHPTIATQKDRDGTLTIQDTHYGYYRLLNGPHAGRVIIKTSTRHDHQPILTLRRHPFTWIYEKDLHTTRCEKTTPTFPEPQHPIDNSNITEIYRHPNQQ
jgi:hypothetical protein